MLAANVGTAVVRVWTVYGLLSDGYKGVEGLPWESLFCRGHQHEGKAIPYVNFIYVFSDVQPLLTGYLLYSLAEKYNIHHFKNKQLIGTGSTCTELFPKLLMM